MKKIIFTIAISLFLGIGALVAQPFDPPGGGGGPTGDPITDPAGVPIDGGISLLIAAGAAYAGKKLYDKKKDEDKEEE